jgi:META domain
MRSFFARTIVSRNRSESSMSRLWLCRRFAFCIVLLVAVVASMPVWPVDASEPFPFGSELMLDAAPMHGSRRVPIIEIEDNGTASIDLWCASLKAQATIDDSAITIVPGAAQPELAPAQCDADRQARDADLLAALTQVTGWHRSGEVIDLTGATPLRFRMMAN